jgi:DNA-directed RNA polymerase specialized sigma24 family protein
VVLHHYAGLSLAEIAVITGVPYGTVGSRLHYALRALRNAMGADSVTPAGQLAIREGPAS